MPIYEYRCEQGHTFEVMQRMSDDPVATCQTCAAPVQRVFHPVAVHFKGSGFYNTDYGTRKRAREKDESSSSTDSSTAKGEPAKGDSAKGDSAKSDSAKTETSKTPAKPAAGD